MDKLGFYLLTHSFSCHLFRSASQAQQQNGLLFEFSLLHKAFEEERPAIEASSSYETVFAPYVVIKKNWVSDCVRLVNETGLK